MKNLLKFLLLLALTFGISSALTACGDDEPDAPEIPVVIPDDEDDDNPQSGGISRSDFIGIWSYDADDLVFHFKGNGSCDLYHLTSWSSYQYDEVYSGSWEFDPSSKILTVTSASFITNPPHNKKWTIKGIKSDEIITDTHDFEKESSLPSKEQSAPTSQLAGTNWSGTNDDIYIELSFKKDGTFTEKYDGYTSTSTYTELDANTIVIGDGTVMSNTFGWEPFNFELNSNKSRLTFYDDYDRWEFTRKQ